MKWEVLRDCLYKYSKKAQDRFFSYFFETYFFARFSLSPKGKAFLLNKEDMTEDKSPRIEAEMKELTN